jgi:NAD(P)-dependent dehydrogenase (short-subunit alcohol dehydrogenase family)
VAVVTGAAGLLGREHCLALLGAGARVVAADVREDQGRRLADELSAKGEVWAHPLDVTSRQSVLALRDAVLQRFGRIDILVNNAALDEKVERPAGASAQGFEELALGDWEDALRVNVTGPFLCCQVLGGEMVRRGGGSIVNIASMYALVAPDQSLYRDPGSPQPFYKSAAYPTTKAAVIGLTRYLAAYWGRSGVRVNALCPGGVQNGHDPRFVGRYAERTPLGRMAAPDEYQGALLFLASDASGYMTGASLVVDGGWTAW